MENAVLNFFVFFVLNFIGDFYTKNIKQKYAQNKDEFK
jgi:hypothetical protein